VLSRRDAAYITGFCEGDGSVGMDRSFPYVSFAQTGQETLRYIESLLPGGIWCEGSYQNGKLWVLRYNKVELRDVLLGYLSEHTVSTRFTSRLNEVLAYLGLSQVAGHIPTISWLAGFFDADGTVVNNTNCGVSVSQKERDVLNVVCGVFGGHVTSQGSNMFQWYAGKRKSNLVVLASGLHSCSHNSKKQQALAGLLTRLWVEDRKICEEVITPLLTLS